MRLQVRKNRKKGREIEIVKGLGANKFCRVGQPLSFCRRTEGWPTAEEFLDWNHFFKSVASRVGWPMIGHPVKGELSGWAAGLGWLGWAGWAGLGWAGLAGLGSLWAELRWAGLGWLGWAGLGWAGLAGLGWAGLGWAGLGGLGAWGGLAGAGDRAGLGLKALDSLFFGWGWAAENCFESDGLGGSGPGQELCDWNLIF